MKTNKNLLLAGIIVVFCCSMAKAQLNYTNALSGGTLIYSNSFTGGAVDIDGTTPTYINPNAANYGGSLTAEWEVITDSVPNNSYAYQNGTLGSHDEGVYLPFTPVNGYVYNFSATLTFAVTPPAGDWDAIGYDTNIVNPIFQSALDPRPSTRGGNPWTLLNMLANGGGAILYESPGTIVSSVPNLMDVVNTPYVINLVLDTTTTNWTAAEYVAGTLINTYTYANGKHASIASFGYGQTTSVAGDSVWGPITLSAVPLAIVQQPFSTNVDEGVAFTNAVTAGGQSPFAYQWYTNGVALADATNAILIFSLATNSDASTDYYCVVTNAYGAVTSAPASLGVYTAPQFLSANPITYTNPMTLFGGSGSYLGSSPSFSVSAGGLLPLSYFWLTNGVVVGGANNTSFTFTNCQMDSPTSFSCIVSNSLATATNTWTAQYIPTPTAPYPQMVISNGPAAYWRLDETNIDPDQYNDGEICDDFMSGNNGIYTNVELSQPGYYVVTPNGNVTNDPTETSADFGPTDFTTGDYIYGLGTNIDFSGYSNAEFTVSCWANGGYLNFGTEPVNGGMVVKGYYGTEEFALDDGGSGGTVRFMIRNAAGTVVSAASTVQLGGNNSWTHLVGVCDESNGVIDLYVNGLLTAQGAATKGSGIFHSAGIPISIGANLLPGNLDGGHQFDGALDDVAIFNKPLSALQVDALFQSSGGVNPLTFTAPVPPTNVVWRQDTTLTIPATALGTPPLGYYWTNVTVGGIVSGTGVKGATGTSVVASLSCTLTITNASASWGGNQLELVVTNATGSTNLFVSLFAYPPPITIGYTNSILYSNEFNGGTWNLNGTAPTVANSLVGGTNTTWTDVLGTNDISGENGTAPGEIFGNGLDNCTLGNSWIFPFTPEPGFIYTETAVVTFSAAPGNWIAEGFGQNYVKNTLSARFNDGATSPNGMDWMLLQAGNGNVEFIDGLDNTFVTNQNGLYTSGAGVNTLVVVLDTTQPQWAQYAWINGVPCGTNVWTSNPTIGCVGITQNSPETVPNNITWNSWSLTAVSPNGFPPYLLAPLPPSSIALTNSTITIPATGYGTGPWGYYWINNSTVLASGATNDTAPNSANLSIASSSLSAGSLDLVLTNALGTNITLITLVSSINSSQTNIMYGVTNGQLYLTWPSDHTGWTLQAQTNNLSVGLSTNWVSVAASTATNQVVIPINLTNGSVFYRLMYNP